MEKVLIVIDAQEDFTRGALRNEEAIKALPTLHEAVRFAEANNMRIIYTQDTHGEDYMKTQEGRNLPVPHCLFESKGWQICPEARVHNMNNVTTIMKPSFGTIQWLYKDIKSANEIWICGFCTDICVSANYQIIKALNPEAEIYVIEDACAGVTLELHEAALKVMASCQAKIVKLDELKNKE